MFANDLKSTKKNAFMYDFSQLMFIYNENKSTSLIKMTRSCKANSRCSGKQFQPEHGAINKIKAAINLRPTASKRSQQRAR